MKSWHRHKPNWKERGDGMDTKILIVDDSKADIAMIKGILSDYYLLVANDGLEAMEMLRKNPEIEIMILDLNMPRMNGFEVLEEIHKTADYKNVSILILTNYDETENEIRGLELGALDYIRKPINIQSLRKRIEVHTSLRNTRKNLEAYTANLEAVVLERTKELTLTRNTTIHALVTLLEVRNLESSNHAKRTQWMMKVLCEHLSSKEAYCHILTEAYINELFETAPLHDIGKVGIPDSILLKPGALTEQEFEVMKKHTSYGVEALKYDSQTATISFLETAIEIVETHHERYDGNGYPRRLKGEEIPLSGRLMAIIDVYDAIINQRVYKPSFDHQTALEILIEERGKHFDANIVDAFLEIEETIRTISDIFTQK